MTRFLTIFFYCLFISYSAFATEKVLNKTYVSGNNDNYQVLYNRHGVILIDEQRKKIYLGKDCDVFSVEYGRGAWGQANGGFIIFFKKFSIGFPKQELRMLSVTKCEI